MENSDLFLLLLLLSLIMMIIIIVILLIILIWKKEKYENTIDCIYYINLEHRKDRYDHINEQFNKMNISNNKIYRIEGIKDKNGYIGCGKSHIQTLNNALINNYEIIMVFEDDFKFIVSSDYFNKAISHLLNNYPEFNICLLSYNMINYNNIDEYLIEVLDAQAGSGYIISKKFIPILLDNFTESVNHLEQSQNAELYAIDQYWKRLQGKDKKWYAFKQPIGIQTISFSDTQQC